MRKLPGVLAGPILLSGLLACQPTATTPAASATAAPVAGPVASVAGTQSSGAAPGTATAPVLPSGAIVITDVWGTPIVLPPGAIVITDAAGYPVIMGGEVGPGTPLPGEGPRTATAASLTPSPTYPPGSIQLVRVAEFQDGLSAGRGIYIAPEDHPDGAFRSAVLDDDWVVLVEGQSPDGLFVRVQIIKPSDDFFNPTAGLYTGLSGWIMAHWLGQGMPLLPAQYPLLETPPDDFFEFRRDLYSGQVMGFVEGTERAQGGNPNDLLFRIVTAAAATQTQWAVLQTPQP